MGAAASAVRSDTSSALKPARTIPRPIRLPIENEAQQKVSEMYDNTKRILDAVEKPEDPVAAKGVNSMTTVVNGVAAALSKLQDQDKTVQLEGATSIAATLCSEAPNIIALFTGAATAAAATGVLAPLAAVLGLVSAGLSLYNGKGAPSPQDILVDRIEKIVESFHVADQKIAFDGHISRGEAAFREIVAASRDAKKDEGGYDVGKLLESLTGPVNDALSQVSSATKQDAYTAHTYELIQGAYQAAMQLQLGLLFLQCLPGARGTRVVNDCKIANDMMVEHIKPMLKILTDQFLNFPDPSSKRGEQECKAFNAYVKSPTESTSRIRKLAEMCGTENDLATALTKCKIFTMARKSRGARASGTNVVIGLDNKDYVCLGQGEMNSVTTKEATFVAFSTKKGSLAAVNVNDEEVYIYCADNSKYCNTQRSLTMGAGIWITNRDYLAAGSKKTPTSDAAMGKFRLKTWTPLNAMGKFGLFGPMMPKTIFDSLIGPSEPQKPDHVGQIRFGTGDKMCLSYFWTGDHDDQKKDTPVVSFQDKASLQAGQTDWYFTFTNL